MKKISITKNHANNELIKNNASDSNKKKEGNNKMYCEVNLETLKIEKK